jgi:hypothetical protein
MSCHCDSVLYAHKGRVVDRCVPYDARGHFVWILGRGAEVVGPGTATEPKWRHLKKARAARPRCIGHNLLLVQPTHPSIGTTSIRIQD